MTSGISEAAGPPTRSLGEFSGVMVQHRLEKMLSHLEGVRQGEEIEAVHQMRVWSRRTRAALEVAEVCLGGKAFREVAQEVKTVTRALGAARDLDVMIANLSEKMQALPLEQQAGVAAFIAYLRKERQAQQKPLVRAVTHLEARDIAAQWKKIIDEVRPPQQPATSDSAVPESENTHG